MKRALLLLGVVIAAAACGGASTGGPSASPVISAAISSSGPLQIVDSAKLGKVLAAANGMTLYVNRGDPNGATCTGSCAQAWPPFVVSAMPSGPAGLTGKLDVLKRTDGATQVTYNGLPLFLFTGDTRPGDANGDGLRDSGGTWSAVQPTAPSGAGPSAQPTPAGAGSSPGYDYGY